MTAITRVFDNPARAQAAAAELKQRHFSQVDVTPAPAASGRGAGALIRVEAPFGTARTAEDILDRHAGSGATPAASKPNGAVAATPASRLAASAPATVAPTGATPPRPVAPAAAAQATAASSAKPDVPRVGSHQGLHGGPRTLSQLLGIPELIDSNTFFSGFPLLIRPTRR